MNHFLKKKLFYKITQLSFILRIRLNINNKRLKFLHVAIFPNNNTLRTMRMKFGTEF